MKPRDKVILQKIAEYCSQIDATHAFFKRDKALFASEENGFIYRNSVTMPILQIGELVKTLSEEFLNEYAHIPWRTIMRMRDVVAHHYGSLDYEIVWTTSVSDIPGLSVQVKEILDQVP